MQTLRKWSRAIFWIVLLSIIAYSVPHFIFFVTGPSHNGDKVEFIIWSVINFLWGTTSSVINQSAIGQFVFVTKTINLTYCNITKQLKGLANGYLTGQQLSDQLIRLQLRHNMATKFLASANQFWKWYLFNFYLTSVPVCIGLTYTLITKFKGNEIVLIWVIGNLLAIIIVSSFAAKVANEATKPYGEIYDILGMPMDDDTKKQALFNLVFFSFLCFCLFSDDNLHEPSLWPFDRFHLTRYRCCQQSDHYKCKYEKCFN